MAGAEGGLGEAAGPASKHTISHYLRFPACCIKTSATTPHPTQSPVLSPYSIAYL
jgi:hypothetical protein